MAIYGEVYMKITVTSETTWDDFISEVANDCLANLNEEDKEYFIKNPFASVN